MGGLSQLPQAIQRPTPVSVLGPGEVRWRGEELTDETALQIVLSDVQLGERFTQSHNASIDWENWDNLYRAIPQKDTWAGTEAPKAALALPVILEAIEKLMPAIYLAFFSDKQPFLLQPMGRTTAAIARAHAHILMWAIKQSDFQEQMRRTIKSALLYGTTMARVGWKVTSQQKDKYTISKDGQTVTRTVQEHEINHPTCEHVEVRNLILDHKLRQQDCRKATYLCGQFFMSAQEVADLAADDTYKNIPTTEELTQALALAAEATPDSMMASKYMTWRDLQATKQNEATSVDPTKQPLEILEYVSDTHIITVLERLIVIRNDINEDRSKNYFSCNFIDVPGSYYGFGVGKLLASEQLLQTGIINKLLDSLVLVLSPSFTEEKGLANGSQQIRMAPGKVFSSVGKLTPIVVPDLTQPATEAIAASEARAARRVGANGGDNMPTQAMRTAEGVNAFERGLIDKLQYFIEIFANLVFVPVLESMLEICKRNLQPKDIRQILADAEAKLYISNILDVYNGQVSISTLTSTKLAARRVASQMVSMILQAAQSAPFQTALAAQSKKFDVVEFMDEVLDLMGWDPDSFIVDASPDEVNRMMQMQPGVAAAQAKQQENSQDLQNQLQVVQAQGQMRAGVQAIKFALEQSGKESDRTEALPPSVPGV